MRVLAITFRDFIETAGAALGLLLAFIALVGVFAKLVVLPWLEDRFAPLRHQVEETHHQVTTNGHTSDQPTLKDAVHTLQNEVRELKGETRADLTSLRSDMDVIGRVYDRHVDWSARESGRLWQALEAIRRHHRYHGNPADDERNNDE